MSTLRIGGIASGFDTEQIIRDLMRVERMKVDRTFQQRQTLQWQKEQYREMTNKVRSFRDQYFDILKPETNLTSASAMKKMSATSSMPGIVSVSAGAIAFQGESTFQVLQSATAAKAIANEVTAGHEEGMRLSMTDTMATISSKLGEAAGEGVLNFEDGRFSLTINDVEIEISESDTFGSVLQRINNSNAGVQVSYSTFSDTFTMTARETGAGHITTDDGGNFFSALGLVPNAEGEVGQSGRDAVFRINGFEGTRTTNSFTIDGITYSINQQVDPPVDPEAPLETIRINVSVDTDAIFNTIEKFISDYNQLIDDISGKLNEERFRGFPPLTDEQKEAMSDREIELWEEKAQSGLLRRDSALENMLRNMRSALYDMVGEGHLSSIGIETSRNYLDNGKLVLKNGGNDLRAAIAENPDSVVDLFARRSDISYSPNLSAEDRSQRYQESGLAHRLSDILQDNIRTTRNSNGRKGVLLERAGIVGDTTEFDNYYDNQIKQVNRQIDRINEMLQRREEQYYRRFTAMEKALQQLHSQGDWLMMQLQQF
ncbi:flagellar filament capping protein FliD [Dethiobacter alkaliphilus]|uniref:Flagellar hook-associated protein 2 n=1 Tax=Dethiobacter alkaliphilus AHT 1 TaxID=555088 RepID=C0GJK0_DETAL|nr:flagellar filament capping protein FliD [Dethiobacter alkaliphilus]EEG76547.1 flagellar hook-associated 2 domain protein [Dethiobacter alkaliphilus AHT 1]